jgi:hypothetical protein
MTSPKGTTPLASNAIPVNIPCLNPKIASQLSGLPSYELPMNNLTG